MNKQELILIPKYERYMQYMIEVIIKMPRTEKFNIGNEFKNIMYKTLENIMFKNRWIDEKKYKISMELLYEIGKILGGLLKSYGKMDKK